MSTMRTVVTNIRAARTAMKDMVRVREIATVLIRHGFGHVVKAWKLEDRYIIGLIFERSGFEGHEHGGAERIRLVLQDLGPTFVKMGQILSTRSDLIPQEVCAELTKLQDNVAPISFADAMAVLEAGLERPIDEVFASVDEKPLASASIAQVHAATLRDGTDVVVKIQRPGIRHTIESDLHILYWLGKAVQDTLPEAEAFDPVSIIREFDRAISKELDFKFEANNLRRFTNIFADWDDVYVPVLHGAYSSETVLVMERLQGVKITEAAALGYDMDHVARQCVRMLFKMVFEDGFFHGDLHPGNLWVLNDGRIGLIDFGLVGRMNQGMKDAMADLLLNIVTQNFEGVARCLYDISIRRGKIDYNAFEHDVIDLMNQYFVSASMSEIDFGAYLKEIVEGAIRHNLRVPPDFTMFFKAVMTVEGIGKIISPELDLIAELQPYVERLVAERYGPNRVLKNVADTVQSFARVARQFPIVASEFLAQLEDGRLNIGVEYPQLNELEQGRQRRSNRLILTLVAIGLLGLGTWTRNDPGDFMLGLSMPASMCFIGGGLILFRILWRIFREGRW
ncbi:MAG: AarF/ABC1/UbiB kinase family protein [Myxococcota bacterium]|nr:AarF/ABC1/UbiB kinase family protein [Myxococcota bacterium]